MTGSVGYFTSISRSRDLSRVSGTHRLRKVYLGRSADLTAERLQEADADQYGR